MLIIIWLRCRQVMLFNYVPGPIDVSHVSPLYTLHSPLSTLHSLILLFLYYTFSICAVCSFTEISRREGILLRVSQDTSCWASRMKLSRKGQRMQMRAPLQNLCMCVYVFPFLPESLRLPVRSNAKIEASASASASASYLQSSCCREAQFASNWNAIVVDGCRNTKCPPPPLRW